MFIPNGIVNIKIFFLSSLFMFTSRLFTGDIYIIDTFLISLQQRRYFYICVITIFF
ncbi:hypothetical protein lam_199 [Candidatus Liberibacter americanus str. Sao Paulo]|uniref:Uncharacterized protein n=1 Tax=Candidatus Liberibacter americanus str. Sao Paulo TaxID=1261131 RepID=U6B4M0_9HYPH|nr:hypothetical protein lam_199 [Candidatus Liberibacter americanus str. Sao Paulo]